MRAGWSRPRFFSVPSLRAVGVQDPLDGVGKVAEARDEDACPAVLIDHSERPPVALGHPDDSLNAWHRSGTHAPALPIVLFLVAPEPIFWAAGPSAPSGAAAWAQARSSTASDLRSVLGCGGLAAAAARLLTLRIGAAAVHAGRQTGMQWRRPGRCRPPFEAKSQYEDGWKLAG